MTDIIKDEDMNEEYVDVYTLTDEETGEEHNFELLAEADIDGSHYVALAPLDGENEDGEGQYFILRVEGEGDNLQFSTFDDEEETFDKVAEFFDDLFFDEVDYDN